MRSWAAWAAGALALAVAIMLALGWAAPGAEIVDVAWLPTLGSRLALRLDSLAAPIAVFTAVLVVPIFVYTAAYLPLHLREAGRRPSSETLRFCALMLAFMASMLLLVVAQDLVILFLALEVSAVISFLLIEFDREKPEARRAAIVALAVTVGSSLAFAVGTMLVAVRTGTTVLSEIVASPDGIGTAAAVCLALGVLGKSAQVPLHFWLPRAMVAPTPVSAYLHSAALVAAGVFVLARIRVLLEGSPGLLNGLVVIGFVSILVGGSMALVTDGLKRVLAYSTIAQYGYAVVMVALGGPEGAVGVALFLVAHGLCKCALFLTAGAVQTTTGADALSQTGGLARRMPWLAVSSAVAAAGLAGVPLTIGYWKDDLLLGAALGHSPALGVLAAFAIVVTLAYTGRFWLGVFAGPSRAVPERRVSPALTGPVVVLGVAIGLGGIWSAPLQAAFGPAGSVVAGHPVHVELELALKADLHTLLAVAALLFGGLAVTTRARWQPMLARVVPRLAAVIAPERIAFGLAALVDALSDRLHAIELRDLRERIAAVVWPTTILVAIGLFARGLPMPRLGPFSLDDIPTAVSLVVCGFAAIATLRRTHHVTRIVLMSFVGYGLSLTFALWGAADVALVIVLIETTLTILVLSFLWHIRPHEREKAEQEERKSPRRWHAWAGVAAGSVATLLALATLGTTGQASVAASHLVLAEAAHAGSAVAAVLADFRALDTAGELTVLAIAILGAQAIAWGRE